MNNEEHARFEQEFPVPRNVWWNPEWCGEGRYEPVNALLQRDSPESAFMQQQRWIGWRAAASSNSNELHHLRDTTEMVALTAGADNEYSQGIMSDGPVILKNGLPMTPEDIVVELSVLQASRAQDGGVPVAWMHDDPKRLDVIHGTVKKVLHDANDAAGHLHRPLDKSRHYSIPLFTRAPSAVVPEVATELAHRDIHIEQLQARVAELSSALSRFTGAAKKAEENGYGQDAEHRDDSWIDDIGLALEVAQRIRKRASETDKAGGGDE